MLNFQRFKSPSTWFKAAHFYLQTLLNAFNMLSALRLTYLTCCVGQNERRGALTMLTHTQTFS